MKMDKREQKFMELDKKLDELSIDEKHFVLWRLLREYGEENAKEIPERTETIEDFRKEKFYHDLCCDCNNLIDILNFDLWR